MSRMPRLTTIGIFLMLWTKFGHSEGYKVPTAKVELLENGFRVSIPDETGVRLVAFNVNRNRNFTSFTEGQYSTRLVEPQHNRWSHDFRSVPLRAHDVLYMWTSVQHERAIFQDLGQPINVCTLAAANLPKGCSSPAQEEPTENNKLNTEDTNAPSSTSSSSSSSERAVTGVCEPSATTISPAPLSAICKGQLLFDESFDQLNETRWMHEVRLPLDTKDAEFVLYDGKARVQDGNLVIQPIQWSSYRPDLSISNSRLDLSERCTGTHNRQKECMLQTSGSGPSAIMPPIVAPRVSTKESFAIKYGRIDIRAKMPKGDWLVPLLLLEPLTEWYGQTGYESGQLRVAMARGNSKLRMPHGKLVDGRSLYAGPVLSTDALQREDVWATQRRNVHFSDEFHTYSLDWSSERLRFSVDGQVYGEMLSGFAELDLNSRWKRGGPMAPFDRMFYITLGLSVGGFGDFVDNLRTATYEKPWMNYHPQAKLNFFEAKEHWLPSWKQPYLLVDYVRVYAN